MTNRIESPHPAVQISHVLASQRFINMVPSSWWREIREIRYHLAQFPGEIPYGTNIGLIVNSPVGSLHLAFNECGSMISVQVPRSAYRALSNRDGVALVAPQILNAAFEILLTGTTTDELWNGPFRPLNSSNLQHWTQPQDHQQPGPDAGDEIEMLDLSLL